MLARFSRSWSLVQASGEVLRQDKELLVFPLCSAIATIILSASFIAPLFALGIFGDEVERFDPQAPFLILGFLFYLCQYFIVFFFNAALVGAAMIRLEGGDPTVADGFRIARSKVVPILGYAAIAATVGLILRLIEERAGFIGRWIAGLLGVAFTVATFMTVPILVARNIGPVDAVKESAALLKKTWGENIIGNGGLGLLFFLIYMVIAGLGFAVIYAAAQTGNAPTVVAAIALVLLAVMAAALIHAALQGVYSAALYRYAAAGDAGSAFPSALLDAAFRPK
jgi:hypothetical protein